MSPTPPGTEMRVPPPPFPHPLTGFRGVPIDGISGDVHLLHPCVLPAGQRPHGRAGVGGLNGGVSEGHPPARYRHRGWQRRLPPPAASSALRRARHRLRASAGAAPMRGRPGSPRPLGTARIGTDRHGTAPGCRAPLCLARLGVARHGTARRDMARCGTIWHGSAQGCRRARRCLLCPPPRQSLVVPPAPSSPRLPPPVSPSCSQCHALVPLGATCLPQ